MKKAIKWVVLALLIPILLFILLAVLLYLPPVQNWAVKKVAAYASEQTGMDISVGHVSLKFPLDLVIDDFKMIKDNDSIPGLRDTIADVGHLVANVQLKPLFKKKVEVDELSLRQVGLNTNGFIPDLRVKGYVESLSLECHGIDLEKSLVNVDKARLDSARLEICLADTVPPDTTQTENKWKIHVDDLSIARADIKVRMPGDTLTAGAYIADAQASDGDFDLENGAYRMKRFDLNGGRLQYDNTFELPVDGLDTNHLDVSQVNLSLDSLSYTDAGLKVSVRSCAFKEKSGFQIDNISGAVALDSTRLSLPSARIKTPDSDISATVEMDMNAFDEKNPGKVFADVDGYVGKQDIMRFLGGMPQDFVRKWPNQPLSIKGKVTGNMQHADIRGLNMSLPTAFRFNADGYVSNLNQPGRMKADVKLKGKADNLDFVAALLDKEINETVTIPRGIALDGDFKVNGNQYGADFVATEGGGNVKAKVAFDSDRMKYSATLDAQRFPLQHFLPKMGLSPLSGHIEADGEGTDFLSSSTSLRAKARIDKFHYAGYDLDGMTANALLHKGVLSADINSRNPLMDGKLSFNALMNTSKVKGTFSCDLKHADFYRLKIADEPLTASICAHVDVDTDLKDYYKVSGYLSDMTLFYKDTFYKPDDTVMDIMTRRDSTYARVESGDLLLDMTAGAGYKRLLSDVGKVSDELSKQLKEKRFDQAALRKRLPDANIYLTSGADNFFAYLLSEEGVSYKNLYVDMSSSDDEGLNGSMSVDSLIAKDIQLDHVNFMVVTDSLGFNYNGQVRNGVDNPQYVFNAMFEGSILERGADINLALYDKYNKLGLDIGAEATIEEDGVRMRLVKSNPVLGYIPFQANEDNYIFLSNDNRLSADLKLIGEDGARLQVYTDDTNMEALQDLTVSVNQLDLDKIMSILPYLPKVSGMANGDFHIVQGTDELTVSSDLAISKLTYEGSDIGNMSTEFVYMPNEDGSHFVDGVLYKDGEEICTLSGTYYPEGKGSLDARMNMSRMPLSMMNGFIPDQLIGFKGYAEGDLTIKGPVSQPIIDGELYLDSTYIYSLPYGVELRAANDPVRIVGSNLLFENFELFSHNNKSLELKGHLDFSDLDKMYLDLRMQARDFQLINAKENLKSETYGKAFVNFFGRMSGPLDALNMRGRLDVLGSTDMTYVLRDSPLTADTRLNELVKFVDFKDTTEYVVQRPPLTGFEMDLTMNVDQAAHIKCDLNADHSNYIDLIGGGELRMRYNVIDDLRLTGRYTLSNGEMKYSLPVIPLKTFTIQDGSYIEFKGDPMNPVLHITATEDRKATVEDEGGSTRSVNFRCGVIITQTLDDMGLEFIIEAPDDVTIGSELASMTTEERSKVAVTMLTTGMYLADGNTSGFTMNGALSSFLQSEINNITGNALRSLDISVGVDNATDASGTMHTDYSFKFAKRFWNNRLRIVVGGKVSTGSETTQNQSFLTNVTFEYRLSPTSNQYVKVFYDRDSYDWLEGDVGEYGVGFLWRRKLQHFKDIFNFKSDSNTPMIRPRNDTLRVDSVRRVLLPNDSINRRRP